MSSKYQEKQQDNSRTVIKAGAKYHLYGGHPGKRSKNPAAYDRIGQQMKYGKA